MGLSDLADPSGGWNLGPAFLDTRRFGIPVARLAVRRGPVDIAALTAAVRDDASAVIVARYPAELTWVAGALVASGRELLPTGGLVYWEAPHTSEISGLAPERGIDVVPASETADDVPGLVEELVRDIFAGYGTHYRFNPSFEPEAILAGYIEWAMSCLDEPASSVLVVRDEGVPAGIATLGWDGSLRDVLLAGVRPSRQGRGIYAALLEGCRADAVARGAARLVISTQTHNVRVQRAWARAGWRPIDAFETVHLMRSGTHGGDR